MLSSLASYYYMDMFIASIEIVAFVMKRKRLVLKVSTSKSNVYSCYKSLGIKIILNLALLQSCIDCNTVRKLLSDKEENFAPSIPLACHVTAKPP